MNNIKKKYNIRIIKSYTSYENKNIENNNKNTENNNLYIYNLKSNSSILHPLTLNKITTVDDQTCLTKYNYKNNVINTLDKYKCNYNLNKYQEYMYIPPIGLSANDILNIYDITTIDTLYAWVENNNDKYILTTIDRILFCWIIININILSSHIKYLSKIILLIIIKFQYNFYNINSSEIKNDIESYIANFISKIDIKNIDNIFLLTSDIYRYLNKKYNL